MEISFSNAQKTLLKDLGANSTNKWLRSRDVRKMLGISDSTLQTMRVNGSIPAYRLGASWFYKEAEILAALESGKVRKEGAYG